MSFVFSAEGQCWQSSGSLVIRNWFGQKALPSLGIDQPLDILFFLFFFFKHMITPDVINLNIEIPDLCKGLGV